MLSIPLKKAASPNNTNQYANIVLSIWKKYNIVLLISILVLLSFIPRLWKLEQYPSVIVDEPANLRDIDLVLNGKAGWITDFYWDGSQSMISYYPTIVLITLLGEKNNFLALRLTSVFLSILALIPFFFILKKYTNILIAFSTTLLFSYSYYYLEFSRVGWINIHVTTIGLYVFWILNIALVKKNILLMSISGILTGILFYLYRSNNVYILGIFIFIIGNLLLKKISIKKAAIPLCAFVLCFSLVSFPWLSKILHNWDRYTLRQQHTSVPRAGPYHNVYSYSDIMKYQIITTLRSWILINFPRPYGRGFNLFQT